MLRRMNTKIICLLLILAFTFLGCSTSANQITADYQTAAIAQTGSIDDSNAIYSTLLKNIEISPENGKKVTLLVINESTDTDQTTDIPIDQVLKNSKVDLSPEFNVALKDYKAVNKNPLKLTNSFDLKKDYVFYNRKEFNAFFKRDKQGKGWEMFYKKFPHSAGFITFSKVGFDREKKHAFVYMEINCGWLCADANYMLLTKEQGVWQVTKRTTVWVS